MIGFTDSQDVKNLVAIYKTVSQNKNYIEDKTAYLMTNSKYYENLRHAFSHLISALDLELEGDPTKATQIHGLYVESANHINNLDVNGYEFLAGYLCNELRERIEKAGLYVNTGNADSLREEALRHLDKGRDLRPENKEEAMVHFEKCIDLCLKAKTQFTSASKIEKNSFRINLVTMVCSGTAVLAAIISIFIAFIKK